MESQIVSEQWLGVDECSELIYCEMEYKQISVSPV